MIEDDVLDLVIDMTAIAAEALGQERSIIPARPTWFRLKTEMRFFRRCLHFIGDHVQAYLVRDCGKLVLIEKVRCAFPYTVTIAGKERPVRASATVYFTTQPEVEGLTLTECLQ